MQGGRFLLMGALGAILICILAVPSIGTGTWDESARVSRLEQQVVLLSQRVRNLEDVCVGPIKRIYVGIGSRSGLRAIQKNGGEVYLANGTSWTISSQDRTTVSRWTLNDEISIEASPNREHPYALVNMRRSELVEAQFLRQQ